MSEVYFYRFIVSKQVFYKSKYTYALVNLKPLVPGHVLVVPLRTSVLRFTDLTPEESQDYMATLQLINKLVVKVHKADSLNIAIQDGPEAGQSVPHLHTHLIPRYRLDNYGDTIYGKLEAQDPEKDLSDFHKRKELFRSKDESELAVSDDLRFERTEEVMHEEAKMYKEELKSLL